MPKRLVDGDALWVSDKLEQVPVEYRGDYAWLLPLAQVNGCFECNPTVVWRECYAARRPDRTIETTATILDVFEAAKMLFRFKVGGKLHGFFIGVQKGSRLPSENERTKYRLPWSVGMLPAKELAKFLGVTVGQVSTEYRGLLVEVSTRPRRESTVGSGIGGGSGCGEVLGNEKVMAKAGVEAYGNDAFASTPDVTPPASPNTSRQHNTTTTPPVEAEDEFIDDDEPDHTPVGKYEELYDTYTAKGFTLLFHLLLWDNPDATSTPKNWLDIWEPDFREMLRTVSKIELADIILISQTSKNRMYFVHPAPMLKNLAELRKWVKEKNKAMPTLRKEFLAQVSRLEREHVR